MESTLDHDVAQTVPSSGERQLRKRPGACDRCRRRKVRCDGDLPSCKGCTKAGTQCSYALAQTQGNLHLLERISQLEGLISRTSNQEQPSRDVQNGQSSQFNEVPERSSAAGEPRDVPNHIRPEHTVTNNVTSPVSSEHTVLLGPQQPIAHEVGLLSLSNSSNPRYIGPSSGLTFARLIYAAAPPSQGLPSSYSPRTNSNNEAVQDAGQVQPMQVPASADLRKFIDAYFQNIHPLYPFLDEEDFMIMAERVRTKSQNSTVSSRFSQCDGQAQNLDSEAHDFVQLFLVIFLGAKMLELRQSCKKNADGYLLSAMARIGYLELQESLRGIQTLLLLLLSSLNSPQGLNAWFLKATIIAACVDLGLQRKILRNATQSTKAHSKQHDIRSGIFWSAYSLERTLSVVLGRPLTLRDEAIDIEYPGGLECTELERDASDLTYLAHSDGDGPTPKRARLNTPPPTPATFSFRFDRIVAEIKLTLYRVAQAPTRFPWPQNHVAWQTKVHEACSKLLQNMLDDFDRLDNPYRSKANLNTMTIHIELKYHHAIMLLYRPSPGIPRPTALALRFCFESAMETIRLHSELHRLNSHPNSWLDAHTVFISGITVCYCLWVSSNIRQVTPFRLFALYADMVKQLLDALSKTWSIAPSAYEKFESLAELTKSSFKDDMMPEDLDGLNLRSAESECPVWPIMPQSGFTLDTEIDWSNMSVEHDNTNLLPSDIPDMSDWFSLSEWLDGTV